ncbi:tetratricopeptide repeat protein [Kangiella koreensis]|uniref:TPR repeat-containing protein n=1 Tax=Kangiella koreensis (strain DSM 16069 / JCM 12317 / KCTC 12182 / SW-125) TaxID=523791 RepID=C7R714_KANKD|nr:hypothetical protein [Kangiella koreensis]ACV27470.1 hypothetical protein Kkor_2060 [Kangiella koreensis DSM 16069]
MNHSVLKTSLNISLKTVLSGLLALPVLLISSKGYTDNNTWVPENTNELVLSYQPSPRIPLKSNLEVYSSDNWQQLQPEINNLLSQSSYPGKSQLEQQAQAYISEWMSVVEKNNHSLTPKDISQLKLFNAQLLQKKHRFNEALQELNSIPAHHQLFAQALLIESRIHHIQGHNDKARQSCGQLLNQKLPLFAQLCLIETEALSGQPEKAYQLIKTFDKQYQNSSDSVLTWYHQVAGSIARILNKTTEAEQHFSFNLNQAPNSQWFQWADMALNNGNADLVMTKMKQLEAPELSLEDGLIIRMARAEKVLGNKNTLQKLVKQRIELRVKRSDQLHAADIAYYYIYIAPQPEQALYWAEKNWLSVKEPADRELLTLAQQLNQKGVAHE